MVLRGLFLLSLVLSSCSYFSSSRTVISVGDLKFTEKYYSARLIEKLKSMDGLHIKDQAMVAEMKKSLTQELIEEGLLINWAKRTHVTASKDEINTLLQNLISSADGVREDALEESQVNRALLEDSLGIQILKKRLTEELQKKVNVSDVEIQNYYNGHQAQFKKGRIHLKQIFLAKEAEAESVLKFLHTGKFTFEALAKKYSMGPEAQQGGDMGWVDWGSGAEIDALFNRGPGLQDKIVTSPLGFHIFKVIEVQRPAFQTLAQVRERVVHAIKEEKLEKAYEVWNQEELKKTQIKTSESLIKALVPSYQETP